MMKLARAVHIDESDMHVFERPARTGEWCISGGFEFSNWSEADLTGKARQAFANGWFGTETFGRVTLVAVAAIEQREFDELVEGLSRHFVERYGAPDMEAARPAAIDELEFMVGLCADHPDNTLLTIQRELTGDGVHEHFRTLSAQPASLDMLAVHGGPDGAN